MAKYTEREYQNWSDGELVRAMTDEQDYQQWAPDLMKQELFRRGISQSVRKKVEKAVIEQIESERNSSLSNAGLFLFNIIMALGSLINILFAPLIFAFVFGNPAAAARLAAHAWSRSLGKVRM